MILAPAAFALKVAAFATVKLPLSVMSPAVVVTANVPLTVEAPKSSVFASVIATLLPFVITTVL